MYNYQNLIKKLENSDEETFWFGACDAEQIEKLEKILGLKLPLDFSEFLKICGGGGAVDSEICGIEDNDATIESGSTINYSTTYCRSEFELPTHLAVIYFKDDEICWAIDCSPSGSGKVISYDLFNKKPSKAIAENFYVFFEEYVDLRS